MRAPTPAEERARKLCRSRHPGVANSAPTHGFFSCGACHIDASRGLASAQSLVFREDVGPWYRRFARWARKKVPGKG